MANSTKKSGGARLTESGRKPVLLGLWPKDKKLIEKAAALEKRPLTQFLYFHGLAAAQKILRKNLPNIIDSIE